MKYSFLSVALLVAAQALICNYLHISMYLTLSLLPAIAICIPSRISTIKAMLIAFAAGFAVDFAAEGVLGLNVVALLPVAGLRKTICNAIFGEEVRARDEDFSIKKYGPAKVIFAVAIAQAIFLFIYVWADGGVTRTLEENLTRFIVSLIAGTMLSVMIANMLTREDR
ncbi:MAG: hypothetical protein IJ151_09570 [Bacteroidales bacterium]|nr:hypothetical protein [Bacteroidales bacterium]MBQ9186099.1 hypothetical protein [Bacteroidales bacterium]